MFQAPSATDPCGLLGVGVVKAPLFFFLKLQFCVHLQVCTMYANLQLTNIV